MDCHEEYDLDQQYNICENCTLTNFNYIAYDLSILDLDMIPSMLKLMFVIILNIHYILY